MPLFCIEVGSSLAPIRRADSIASSQRFSQAPTKVPQGLRHFPLRVAVASYVWLLHRGVVRSHDYTGIEKYLQVVTNTNSKPISVVVDASWTIFGHFLHPPTTVSHVMMTTPPSCMLVHSHMASHDTYVAIFLPSGVPKFSRDRQTTAILDTP